MKETIFISHATPEDNAFTRWLGSKLELAGYKVWHDLARLKGGDYFWDKIEAAIRNESFRFLAVVSTVSVTKSGVKDELAVAATIERSLPGFVIPLRIDHYDFGLFPITIHRKNALDFANGWHKGLAALLDTLEDAGAPRVSTPDPAMVRHWLADMKDGAILRTENPEKLDSTWLPVLSLPPSLETARFLGSERKIKLTQENIVLPWFEHEDRIVGFAKSDDLVSLMKNSAMLKAAAGVDMKTFIESGGKLGDKPIPKGEARKRVANLVRQAWELTMEAKGLGIHEQSGGRKVFYVTPVMTKGERIAFVDVDGRIRKKALHGRSEKRKANWSYAVGMVPAFDDPWRIELRSTIVFTDDEGRPMDAPAKAHRLRMSFCRSWWNDRWRGFLRAFLSLVAEGQSEIRLPVGSDRHIVIGAAPIMFTAPAGLSDLAPSLDIDAVEEPDEDLDDLDEVEEDEAVQ
ncbi:MAG: toll/interleukin-1 receptor domain-containing protein [Pseudomonadota bacterium]